MRSIKDSLLISSEKIKPGRCGEAAFWAILKAEGSFSYAGTGGHDDQIGLLQARCHVIKIGKSCRDHPVMASFARIGAQWR